MTEQRLSLYFRNLKEQFLNGGTPAGMTRESEVDCVVTTRRSISLSGLACPSWDKVAKYDAGRFVRFSDHAFLLRKKDLAWVISNRGLNHLLQQRDGLGTSGETYLVGEDRMIRSASRFLPKLHPVRVNNFSVEQGLKKEKGVEVLRDYRGVKVVSAYGHFEFDQLRYVLLSEIDWDEVTLPLRELVKNLLLIGAGIFILSLSVALLLTRSTLAVISRMEDQLESLHSQAALNVLRAQEEERQRIAYNLHDSVGQYLTALKWELARRGPRTSEAESASDKRRTALDLIDTIIKEIRSISHDSMPSIIKDFGCFVAIKDYCHRQGTVYPFSIECEYPEELERLELASSFQINLYRMAQELVQNGAKHARARTLRLRFCAEVETLRMEYDDDGIGMTDDAPLPHSLQYRAKLFGGRMARCPTPKGLALTVTFRLEEIR